MTISIINAILQIFAFMAIGILARRLNYVREAELLPWSRFAIDFLFPGLIFHSIVTGLDDSDLSSLWRLPVLGLGIMVIGALAGLVFRLNKQRYTHELARTFHHFCATNNFGFLPIIIVQQLWGTGALADLFIFNLGSSVGYWTIGVGLLGDRRQNSVMRNLITLYWPLPLNSRAPVTLSPPSCCTRRAALVRPACPFC
ncbi:MAG: AEC family transporter [Verrucomicrobia bacterium]|nr:AEC family transporter [Verrucomicrobiota bacterium]